MTTNATMRIVDEYEQSMAARDGETGYGGCGYCNAVYELTYNGNGVMHVRIGHHKHCPVVRARMRELPGFISDADPGDEQP